MEKVIITNIKWDTDGEYNPELPIEVSLNKWTNDEEEILETVSEILFTMYGDNVTDFEIHYRKEEKK